MLKIRLQRIGKKNDPSYRIALVEHTTSPQGKFIELLGSYSPKLKEKKFDKGRIEYWLTKGAQASPTVHNLLVSEKIISKEKVKAWKPKKKAKEEVKPEAPKTETQPVEASAELIKTEEPKVEEAPKEEPKTEEAKSAEELKPEELQLIDNPEQKD
jgi:small subunit ribosomal protein S16